MVKGLKETSELITIGFRADETVIGTMAQTQIDLQLNALDQEVLIVYSIALDPDNPDAVAATNTATRASVSSTSRTTLGNLEDTNVMAVASHNIRAAGFVDGGVSFADQAMEVPPTTLPYIGIIATSDFFCQVQGTNNLAVKGVSGKMFCARAKASSAVYAALVQSEVLTSA